MPKVLILGATGYVGSAVAASLVRSGDHVVYGLARNSAKATSLVRQEIIPVSGSVTDSAAYLSLIRTAHIDVVVDCSGANQESTQLLSDLHAAGKERLEAHAKAGMAKGPKLGFVYTSGIWVHGSSHARTSDLEPVGNHLARTQPPRMVAWKPQLEQQILAASDVLDVCIVRPGVVYGREGGVWAAVLGPVLEAAKAGKTHTVTLPLDPHAMLGLVHVDDIGSGIHAAVDKLPLISGTSVYPVFDFVGSTEWMKNIVHAAGTVWGFKGQVELVGAGDDVFSEALGTSYNGTSARAKQLLSWSPKKQGLLNNIDVYAAAFEAAYLAGGK